MVAGFFNGLSAESRRRRFLRPIPRLPEAMLRRLREVDGRRQVAVVADEPDAAEVAVAVAYQGCGIGRLLVDALRPIARPGRPDHRGLPGRSD